MHRLGRVLSDVVDDAQGAVLSSWLADAKRAYLEACLLLSIDTDDLWWIRDSRRPVRVDLLIPAYLTLADRFANEVCAGDQPDLFDSDFETQLVMRWMGYACGFMRQQGCAEMHRAILQSTVGLESGSGMLEAARELVECIRDAALPARLIQQWVC